MMWVKSSRREAFLDFAKPDVRFEIDGARQAAGLPGEMPTDGFLLVWRDDPVRTSRLPAAIILNDDAVSDLMAWLGTYLSNLRPITALSRVLSLRDAKLVLGSEELEFRESFGMIENVLLALILGEAAGYVEGRTGLRGLHPVAFLNTLSFAVARSAVLYGEGFSFDAIANSWTTARRLTGQRQSSLPSTQLQAAWQVALQLGGSRREKEHHVDPRVLRATEELLLEGDMSRDVWEGLSAEFPSLARVRSALSGPVEARVRIAESALRETATAVERDSSVAMFLTGYVLSRVSQGDFDHTDSLRIRLGVESKVLPWLGLCAGLVNGPSVLNFGSGLGRWIRREVFRKESLLDSPRSDIALSELQVLVRSETSASEFRTCLQGYLQVEILPCITVPLKWPPARDVQGGLFPGSTRLDEGVKVIGELDDVTRRVEIIRDRIAKLYGVPEKPRAQRREKRRD